jgi:hypothetical protein
MPLQPPITKAKPATNVISVFVLGIIFILLLFFAFRKYLFDLAGALALTPHASQAWPNFSLHRPGAHALEANAGRKTQLGIGVLNLHS